MSNDAEKPTVPESKPATPPAAPPVADAPGSPKIPVASAPGAPQKRPFKRGGGDDRGPRKRERGPVRSLQADLDYHTKVGPNVRDLDAEIADELEAALKGMDDKNLYSADDSKRARDQAAVQAEGGRKIGKVISIHPPDHFLEIPGGR
ncbi:MAG: hypothetical protein HY289_15705, partial [Planctomycetes bacterium]|nr:hypothetical protein [Planctomycetota bacterium]